MRHGTGQRHADADPPRLNRQVQPASHLHADETRHQRGGERRWMWMALRVRWRSVYMTAYGRSQDAAKRLLGLAPEGVLVTDQYAGYRFIDPSQRQLSSRRIWHTT